MEQQCSSNLPPLPEDAVEEQYAEESEEKDQTETIQSLMKQITEESPSSSTPGPKATSTSETEQRPQTDQRWEFYSTPTNTSPLQQQIPRQERPVVKIKAKDYNLNLNGEEVEMFMRKVERIAQV
ncbi:hypothetical protein O181_061702 [Austropuccinia psidii MF-1]|uniref:Uncharacterized protein n=1 Tax=Austropuccinia psidii MF-1 TaxID=1389203 RepID=A0A9Q3EQY7_9BASI|nr:hypothetical protein [Austropuccinia psidii MF-1]